VPHVMTFLNDTGLGAINARFKRDYKVVMSEVERIVAEAFNELTGDSLVPGDTVTHDHGRISKTMSADIVVIVLSWSTPQRLLVSEELRDAILNQVLGLFPDIELNAQVFLNFVG
jgi:hypothetical protein